MEEKNLQQTSLSFETLPFHQLTQSRFHQSAPDLIPHLPVIDELVAVFTKLKATLGDLGLERTVVIGMQHLLETTGTLVLDGLIGLGIKPNHIYLAGKSYSTSKIIENELLKKGIHIIPMNKPPEPGQYLECCIETVKEMWHRCIRNIAKESIDRIIVLDDGGRTSEYMPGFLRFEKYVGVIEQTRGGLYSTVLPRLPCRVIQVATCLTKKKFESKLIANAVSKALDSSINRLCLDIDMVFGVIGNGDIGAAVVEKLVNKGFKVVVYDPNPKAFSSLKHKSLKFYRMDSIEALLVNADCIIGCTGRDILAGISITDLIRGKKKFFMSCSSEDREFLSLLKMIAKNDRHTVHDTLGDIRYKIEGDTEVVIVNGGFPINFTRQPSSVPAHDIQLTRGLLLGSVIQAILDANKPIADGITINHSESCSVDPYIQRFVFNLWIKQQPEGRFEQELIANMQDISWIIKNSGGEYHPNLHLQHYFEKKQEQALDIMPSLRAKL